MWQCTILLLLVIGCVNGELIGGKVGLSGKGTLAAFGDMNSDQQYVVSIV
jgi:hypothetical protein